MTGKALTSKEIIQRQQMVLRANPQKFAMWLFIATVMMLFAAFTSAYIVRQSQGDWLLVDLPQMFWYNSGLIILSSITMHWAWVSAKKDNFALLRLAIVLTTMLGVGFMVGQFYAYAEMVDNNFVFVGNNINASFIYVITFVHVVHLLSAVIFLLIVLYAAFTMNIHSKKLARLEMCVTYWHFLGGLWIYLFMFLYLNQ